MHTYVKELLKPNIINFPFRRQIGVEDLWVNIQSQMYPVIIIGCVYRHSKAPVVSFEYVQDVLSQLCFGKKKKFICFRRF